MSIYLNHLEFEDRYYKHYYLCNYRPKYSGKDELSESLIRFKRKERIDVEAWTECAALELNKMNFHQGTWVLRALTSGESKIKVGRNITALDFLGEKLASELDLVYNPFILEKRRPTVSVKMMTKTEREEELKDAYNFMVPNDLISQILIIDDILTTGTTMKEIVKAIRYKMPEPSITLFTLADTDHQAVINNDISLKGHNYEWENRQWETVTEPQPFYHKLQILKDKILMNNFN